mgnify:CR=1 FL=1
MEDELLNNQLESVQADKERERADDDYSDEKQKAYQSVKSAVEDSIYSLSVKELAEAISIGVFNRPDQVKVLQELASELVEHSGIKKEFQE